MAQILKQLTLLVARIHDRISAIFYALIPGIDDKFLHFFVIGILGIICLCLLHAHRPNPRN